MSIFRSQKLYGATFHLALVTPVCFRSVVPEALHPLLGSCQGWEILITACG